MKLDRFLLIVVLALSGVCIAMALTSPTDVEGPVHPRFESMYQGRETPDATLVRGWAFGALSISSFAALVDNMKPPTGDPS